MSDNSAAPQPPARRVTYLPARLDSAVVAPIETALGADQVAVATTGQLIEVLSRLPADTPLTVTQYAMAAAGLTYADEEETVAVVWPATLTRRSPRGPGEVPPYESSTVAGVELGACLVHQGGPLPQDMAPWCPHERVSAMLKQISDLYPNAIPATDLRPQLDDKPAGARSPEVMFTPEAGRKPLTKREREVLSLISDGYSNKQGALRMNISPRTFESHRAEAMRKLGARNTADLVRKALLHSA